MHIGATIGGGQGLRKSSLKDIDCADITGDQLAEIALEKPDVLNRNAIFFMKLP